MSECRALNVDSFTQTVPEKYVLVVMAYYLCSSDLSFINMVNSCMIDMTGKLFA